MLFCALLPQWAVYHLIPLKQVDQVNWNPLTCNGPLCVFKLIMFGDIMMSSGVRLDWICEICWRFGGKWYVDGLKRGSTYPFCCISGQPENYEAKYVPAGSKSVKLIGISRWGTAWNALLYCSFSAYFMETTWFVLLLFLHTLFTTKNMTTVDSLKRSYSNSTYEVTINICILTLYRFPIGVVNVDIYCNYLLSKSPPV